MDGFIGQSSLVSWRWNDWIALVISGLVLFLVVLFQPEMYAPKLLKWKAAKSRRLAGEDQYESEVEIREVTFVRRLGRAVYLYQHCLFMFHAIHCLHSSIAYCHIYHPLHVSNAYTLIFTKTYGFIEHIIGRSLAGQDKRRGWHPSPTRVQVDVQDVGGPAVSFTIFLMSWIAYPGSPLGVSVLVGYGIMCIFIDIYRYIIESYVSYETSVLSSVTLIRYVASGRVVGDLLYPSIVATPVLERKMLTPRFSQVEIGISFYKDLGVHWTLIILGCLSASQVPTP